MNIQPIEKREHRTDGQLVVHSIFPTIQGEGPFCGTPCVFVRLAGCNLQCPACDTDYTSNRRFMSAQALFEEVCDVHTVPGRKLVVITGGEPFRQNLEEFILMLVAADFYVQIESNGTLPPPPIRFNKDPGQRQGAYIVCSPKTGKLHSGVLGAACALKYVVRAGMADPLDGLPTSALDMPNRPARPPLGWDRAIYVQPLDSKDPVENMAHANEAVASCMRYGYVLQVQVHKLVGVE